MNDNVLNGVIHHGGRKYIYADADLTLNKNSENSASFNDMDYGRICVVVKHNSEEYI